MNVIEVEALISGPVTKLTPSNLNWILQCPLRGLYMNIKNRAYFKRSFTPRVVIGNLIHKINEDFSNNKINSEAEFQAQWTAREKMELSSMPREKIKNIAVYKALTKANVLNWLSGSGKKVGKKSRYVLLAEEPLKDEINNIEGKVDLLILRNSTPVEIKDYKTGNIYELNTLDTQLEKDDNQDEIYERTIKEDYRKQLLLYAWLVKQKYAEYPERLTIVDNEGAEHSVEFDEADIDDLIIEVKKVREALQYGKEEVLANPSVFNCRYCSFRFRCQFNTAVFLDPVGDIAGNVTRVKSYPYGTLEVELNGNTKVIFPIMEEKLREQDLLYHNIVISFVRRYFYNKNISDGLSDFYIPTNYSEIIKLI